tara:strand:+ start:76 stop:369 length:294 start_codon:yes stop_codon:yes gene_type:complete
MKTEYIVNNKSELINIMENLSKKDKYIYIACIIYNSLYVSKFKYLSKIPKAIINDLKYKNDTFGYWKCGKFYRFKKDFIKNKNKIYRKNKFNIFSGG